eukprot:3568864-Prymnesium_polylepis.1
MLSPAPPRSGPVRAAPRMTLDFMAPPRREGAEIEPDKTPPECHGPRRCVCVRCAAFAKVRAKKRWEAPTPPLCSLCLCGGSVCVLRADGTRHADGAR